MVMAGMQKADPYRAGPTAEDAWDWTIRCLVWQLLSSSNCHDLNATRGNPLKSYPISY